MRGDNGRNKQDNKKGGTEEEVLHEKVVHDKSSTAAWSSSIVSLLSIISLLLNIWAPCGYAYIPFYKLPHDD